MTLNSQELIEAILAAQKLMNDAPVPTKDRMIYDPETDSVVMIEDNHATKTTRTQKRNPMAETRRFKAYGRGLFKTIRPKHRTAQNCQPMAYRY